VLEKYPKDLKVVFKNFPLPMHAFSRKAAAAALAAFRQGKFREFHIKLFESSNTLSDEKIQAIAKEMKLNMKTFNRDMNDPAIQSIIYRDMNEGEQAEVRGTPTMFINGKLLRIRSLQAQEIDDAIEAELKKIKEEQ
jgi:protein-disulfide isomerase